jgi:hypothetical protein
MKMPPLISGFQKQCPGPSGVSLAWFSKNACSGAPSRPVSRMRGDGLVQRIVGQSDGNNYRSDRPSIDMHY